MAMVLDVMFYAVLFGGIGYVAVGAVLAAVTWMGHPCHSQAAAGLLRRDRAKAVEQILDLDLPDYDELFAMAAAVGKPDRVVAMDHVVPFVRPVQQKQWTDAELIRLAKQHRFPGSGKWSYTRRLSSQIRADLIQLAV